MGVAGTPVVFIVESHRCHQCNASAEGVLQEDLAGIDAGDEVKWAGNRLVRGLSAAW